MAKEILKLSDKIEDDNPVKVQRARLQVDSRKWLAARMAPKKYGDRISHDVKGGTNINFQPQILIQCSSGEYEELYATSEAASGPAQQGNGDIVTSCGMAAASRSAAERAASEPPMRHASTR